MKWTDTFIDCPYCEITLGALPRKEWSQEKWESMVKVLIPAMLQDHIEKEHGEEVR